MKLIDKDALVAEIEKWLGETDKGFPNDHNLGRYDMCKQMLSFLDTLEVKEVDIDKETTHYLLYEHRSPLNEIMHRADIKSEIQYCKDIGNAFKAGFKLGIKAQKEEEV